MPLNPLQNIGTNFFPRGSSGVSKHAQDLSASKLQQRIDRENAKVSMDRVIRGGSGFSPTTSISHLQGDNASASSSVFHAGVSKRSIYDEEEYDEVRDRIRYAHIRGMMKQKQAQEEAAKQQQTPSKYEVGVKTGGGFRTKGKRTFVSKIKSLRRTKPVTYKNISNKDIDYFVNLVKPHATIPRSGSPIGRVARSKMKLKIEQDRREGKISLDDAKDMKKMIDNLPH